MAVLARLVKRVLVLPTTAGELVTRTLLVPPSVLLSERKLARGAGAAAVMSWPLMGANGCMPDTKGLAGTRAVGCVCSTSAPGCASASRPGATGAIGRLQATRPDDWLTSCATRRAATAAVDEARSLPKPAGRSQAGLQEPEAWTSLTPLTGCCKVARSDPCPYAPLVHSTQVATLAAGLPASAALQGRAEGRVACTVAHVRDFLARNFIVQ